MRARRRLRDLGTADDPARDVALFARGLDQLHDVIPVNWPPVRLSTWPWTKFDHGEQRKNTAGGLLRRARPAERDQRRGIERICSGMPSCTVWPPISIVFSASLVAVRRVSIAAERDRVDVDLELAPLLGQRLGQADHRGLAAE